MGQKEKLIERLRAKPKTFTFDDAESPLRYFGYSRSNKGRTSGSRICFTSEDHPPILIHKPRPRKEIRDQRADFLQGYEVCVILNKIAANQNGANEKKSQSYGQRKRMPDKTHFFRLPRVVTNFYF